MLEKQIISELARGNQKTKKVPILRLRPKLYSRKLLHDANYKIRSPTVSGLNPGRSCLNLRFIWVASNKPLEKQWHLLF